MIAAVVVVIAIYFAIRNAIIELYQNLQNFCHKWEEYLNIKLFSEYAPATSTSSIVSEKLHFRDANRMTVEDRNMENEKWSARTTAADVSDNRRQRNFINGRNTFSHNPFEMKSRFKLPTLFPQLDRIATFKVSPTIPDMKPPRPTMGACCSTCVPASKLSYVDDTSSTLGISNILRVPKQNREYGVLKRTFYHIAFIFKKTVYYAYPDVSTKVLRSERVLEAIDAAVQDEIKEAGLDPQTVDPEIYEALKKKHNNKAIEAMLRMRSCISSALLKLARWVLYKLLGRMLTGIQVHKGHIETLHKVSQRKLPIIYLPLHRSHLDYILVTFILYIHDLQAPIIAAGDNLLIPFFGALMRGLGAFFIKRKMDTRNGKKDHVYRAILQTYMQENLKAGNSLEFFIEGGRSRTGKACMPKAGLLSVVVDSILEGVVEDAYIVPVGISYEKILEGNFVTEQLGKPKVTENFTTAVRAIWSTLHSNFGNVRVDFCQPYSLKEFLLSAKRRHSVGTPPPKLFSCENNAKPSARRKSSTSSLYGLDIVRDDNREVIKDLSYHVVHDAANSIALMSTNLLAFLFLTKFRKGGTVHQLAEELDWLREELSSRRRDIGFSGESVDVVKHSCALLGKELITTEKVQLEWSSIDVEESKTKKLTYYRPVIRLPFVLELQYYANSVIQPFLIDSVVANAILSELDEVLEPFRGCTSQFQLSFNAIVQKSLILCDILQYEFVFTPACNKLTNVIADAIARLIGEELLSLVGNTSSDINGRSWSNRMAGINDWGSDEEEEGDGLTKPPKDQILKLNLTEESLKKLEFLRCILSPLVETYWVAACSLVKLINVEKEESLFFREIHKTAEERLHQGLLAYEESFAVEPLKNSLKLFESWDVLESHTQDSVRLVYLQSCFNSEESLKEVITRIQKFRK